ncbi:GMC oxidoreductase-domain-containing protein, partial [Mycena sp. CBHHK59/15]
DAQLLDIINTIATSGPEIDDINSKANDAAPGVGPPSYTVDEYHNRSSVHERLLQVQKSAAGRLHFAFETLVTKVSMCEPGYGQSPTAYGVEIARGAALAVASNFKGKHPLKTRLVTARHEVIISAGVFQSPQLVSELTLSGIGNQTELASHGIKSIVHLPGVGTNLQDHDEVANIWTLKQNHTLFNGCTVLYTPEDDPCLKFWTESGHQNLYSFGAALFFAMNKSAPGLPDPDIMTYWAAGSFRGFFHGFADELADVHNGLTAVVLKADPSSRGVVRLSGSHPQDLLYIEKRHFEAPGGAHDVAVIRDEIKAVRNLVTHPNISMHIEAQVFPAANAQTDVEIDDHIFEHVFGMCSIVTLSRARPDYLAIRPSRLLYDPDGNGRR